jgi:hypothetical protein
MDRKYDEGALCGETHVKVRNKDAILEPITQISLSPCKAKF